MKRKHTENSSCVSASAVAQEDLSDVSDDIEDTYNSKVASIQDQIDQLANKKHPEYVKIREEIENWYSEEKQRIQILHEHKLDTIYREYTKEAEACDRDCEHEKRRIQTYLISLCEELKRRLEHDKKNIELTPSGDILEFKPALTRKLRRRVCGGGGGGGGGGGNDASTSIPANFTYWGDLLLCGSRWSINPSINSKSQKSELSNGIRSPVTNNDDENMDPLQIQSNIGNESKENTSNDIAISTHSNTYESSSCVSSASASLTIATAAAAAATTTTTTATNTSSFNSTSKTNIFGSLGLNLFDGSLLSHLLVFMNSNSTSSFSNFYQNSSYCLSGTSDNGSSVNNYLNNGVNSICGSSGTNFIIPSNGTNNGVGLSNSVGLSPVVAVAFGCGLIPSLNNNSSIRKRRHQNNMPSAQLNLLLPEHDIYADLTVIHRACSKASNASNSSSGTTGGSRKHAHMHGNNSSNAFQLGHSSPLSPLSKCYEDNIGSYRNQKDTNGPGILSSLSTGSLGSPNPYYVADSSVTRTCTRSSAGGGNNSNSQPNTSFSVWIDDGRLYCGHKCYQIGASVILEGRDVQVIDVLVL
ncbi:unnamed protein product [Heterobilharzia americana]|nr:unnamed protein product [Heterobilharzia americana]